MSFTYDLCVAVAGVLVDDSVGVWKPDEPFTEDDTAIVIGLLPDMPDKAIALNPYPVSDDIAQSEGVHGVQVRCRGTEDKQMVYAIADAVFNSLQGRQSIPFATGKVIQVQRMSSTPFGPDASLREEYIDNYYLTCYRPSQNRES